MFVPPRRQAEPPLPDIPTREDIAAAFAVIEPMLVECVPHGTARIVAWIDGLSGKSKFTRIGGVAEPAVACLERAVYLASSPGSLPVMPSRQLT